MIEFTVPAVPIAQPRHRIGTVGGKARAFQAPKSHPIYDFKATCRFAASEAYDGPPLDGPLEVELLFVFPRTKGQTWKRRAMVRMPHSKRPDVDNLFKGVADSLSGLLWLDDSQIAATHITKVIAGGDEQPRVEIRVMEASL